MDPNNNINPDKTIGEILVEAREKSGITRESLSSETKIKLETLIALENNSLQELPSLPYIKAFLVTLSKKLNLQSAPLITLLINQMGVPKEETFNQEKKEPFIESLPSQKIWPLIGLLFCGVLAFLFILKIQPKSQDQPPPPVNDSISRDSLPGLTEIQSDSLDSLKPLFTKDSLIVNHDSLKAKEPNTPSKPISKLSKDSTTKLVKSISKFLVLNCLKDSVWVNVKRTGKREVNKKMSLGSNWTLSLSDTIIVTSGIPAAIEFNLNGKSHQPAKKKFIIIQGKLQLN